MHNRRYSKFLAGFVASLIIFSVLISPVLVSGGDSSLALGQAITVSVVDGSANDVGKYSSLALDQVSRPHISYFDATSQSLKYAHWTGISWDVQLIDSVDENLTAKAGLAQPNSRF